MAGPPTPEEKLFAVIQGAKHKPLRRPPSPSLAELAARLRGAAASLDVPKVNQALLALMVPLGAWCALGPFFMRPSSERLLARARQQVTPFLIAPPQDGLRPAEESAQLLRSHDLFGVGEPAAAPAAPAAPVPPPAQPQLSDLRLVGIARGAAPTAMVEQVSANMTHVLKVGDAIDGFTVTAILEDRVMLLDPTGQEVALF